QLVIELEQIHAAGIAGVVVERVEQNVVGRSRYTRWLLHREPLRGADQKDGVGGIETRRPVVQFEQQVGVRGIDYLASGFDDGLRGVKRIERRADLLRTRGLE